MTNPMAATIQNNSPIACNGAVSMADPANKKVCGSTAEAVAASCAPVALRTPSGTRRDVCDTGVIGLLSGDGTASHSNTRLSYPVTRDIIVFVQ